MNNNPLINVVARQLLLRMGYTESQIKQGIAKMRAGLPLTPPKIDVKGQTEMFSKSGNLRNFRSPTGSAQLPPTLSPVPMTNRASLNPGPVRPPAPGQMSIFGTNPSARVTAADLRTAPDVPLPKQGGRVPGLGVQPKTYSPEVTNWVEQNTKAARLKTSMARQPVFQGRRGNLLQGLLMTMGIPTNVPLTALQLSLSNFGQAGEPPEVAASRLGYASAAQRKLAERMFNEGVPPEQIKAIVQGKGLEEQVPTRQVQPDAPVQTSSATAPTPRTAAQVEAVAPVATARPKPQPTTTAVPKPKPARKPAKPKPGFEPEQAYGPTGKSLYMKSKGANPLMRRYFGETYATDTVRKLK